MYYYYTIYYLYLYYLLYYLPILILLLSIFIFILLILLLSTIIVFTIYTYTTSYTIYLYLYYYYLYLYLYYLYYYCLYLYYYVQYINAEYQSGQNDQFVTLIIINCNCHFINVKQHIIKLYCKVPIIFFLWWKISRFNRQVVPTLTSSVQIPSSITAHLATHKSLLRILESSRSLHPLSILSPSEMKHHRNVAVRWSRGLRNIETRVAF